MLFTACAWSVRSLSVGSVGWGCLGRCWNRSARSICAVAGIISNFFKSWRREISKLGGLAHCYYSSGYVKYWKVGVCFRSSLLGFYCGGGHGRVIGVFVRRGGFFHI